MERIVELLIPLKCDEDQMGGRWTRAFGPHQSRAGASCAQKAYNETRYRVIKEPLWEQITKCKIAVRHTVHHLLLLGQWHRLSDAINEINAEARSTIKLVINSSK